VRIGVGYDIHPLREGRKLVIGGVHIRYSQGLDGHSDADVLTHAVVDALFGAAGLGDIGKVFPSDDPKYEGASSLNMLSTAAETIRAAGYRIVNVDSTVIAEAPRLQPHLHKMRQRLSASMKIDVGHVNVKATSPEGLGALGRKQGIAAQAVALIEEAGAS
jgi:2-C-methyl-D-erythritol 2,4-cyclodiphosphate synthase